MDIISLVRSSESARRLQPQIDTTKFRIVTVYRAILQ
jgi:hypothetical protein